MSFDDQTLYGRSEDEMDDYGDSGLDEESMEEGYDEEEEEEEVAGGAGGGAMAPRSGGGALRCGLRRQLRLRRERHQRAGCGSGGEADAQCGREGVNGRCEEKIGSTSQFRRGKEEICFARRKEESQQRSQEEIGC